jgi:hypothetical protein
VASFNTTARTPKGFGSGSWFRVTLVKLHDSRNSYLQTVLRLELCVRINRYIILKEKVKLVEERCDDMVRQHTK